MAGATCVMATMAVAHAEAGTYHVLACSDLGLTSAVLPNNAWTQMPANAPTGLEAFVACPSMRGDRCDGIAAQDHVPGPSEVDAGTEVFWRFAAPPGTSIARISVVRSLGKAGVQSWRPFGRGRRRVRSLRHRSGRGICENTGNATFAINDPSTITTASAATPRRANARPVRPTRGVDVALPPTSWSPIPARPHSPAGRADRCGTRMATTGQLRAPASGAPTTRGSPRRTGSSTAASRPLTAAAATAPSRFRPTCRLAPSTA